VLDRPVEQVADPLHANLRGSALLAGMALGEVEARELHSLVQVEEVHAPEPATRRVYDQLFAEFPTFYSSQKGLFSRLNDRRAGSSPS
jgi:xylulokinase